MTTKPTSTEYNTVVHWFIQWILLYYILLTVRKVSQTTKLCIEQTLLGNAALAPCCMRRWTISTWPFCTAQCRALMPIYQQWKQTHIYTTRFMKITQLCSMPFLSISQKNIAWNITDHPNLVKWHWNWLKLATQICVMHRCTDHKILIPCQSLNLG